MRRPVIILALLALTGCVADSDHEVAGYDAASYYDDGGYYADPYVYGDTYYDPGPRAYVSTGYYSGRPWPYYGGYYRNRDRHVPDYRDHDRHDGPDRQRSRDSRGDGPSRSDGPPRSDGPSRADAEPPRVRTRTGFQRPSDRPAARPSPRGGTGHGTPSRR